ncbi:hypothetical protein ACLOJK_008130 [Asimina triloba]
MRKYTLQVHGLQYTAGAPVSMLHRHLHGCRRRASRRHGCRTHHRRPPSVPSSSTSSSRPPRSSNDPTPHPIQRRMAAPIRNPSHYRLCLRPTPPFKIQR